ncbi:MAG: hypothetical protein HC929_05045 [Leptolyngbyaceae cyanobacterium SM2_5_2]|nr:hypothetical protein [Leptolyngbyaceae cyanobacterium SM2_5_2]
MTSGNRHSRQQRQRGALGGVPSEPVVDISDLAHQAEQLEVRIQHLKTGLSHLVQLTQAQATPAAGQEHQLAQAELARLEKDVECFELDLANRFFTWQHLREPFWQAVRYGGLGLVVGWLLHWLVRGS